MSKHTVRVLLVLVGSIIVACVACRGLMEIYNELGPRRLARAAENIGVEPTLQGIEGYIKDSVEPGMSKDEVEEILETIAPVEVKHGEPLDYNPGWGAGGTCDHITLRFGPMPGYGWPMIACYDIHGELVSLRSEGRDRPTIDIYR
jgi:hypothetical protein